MRIIFREIYIVFCRLEKVYPYTASAGYRITQTHAFMAYNICINRVLQPANRIISDLILLEYSTVVYYLGFLNFITTGVSSDTEIGIILDDRWRD